MTDRTATPPAAHPHYLHSGNPTAYSPNGTLVRHDLSCYPDVAGCILADVGQLAHGVGRRDAGWVELYSNLITLKLGSTEHAEQLTHDLLEVLVSIRSLADANDAGRSDVTDPA